MLKKICKKAPIFICILILSLSLFSCSSSNNDVLGGDVVRYSYCVFNDQYQLASIPIITKKDVRSAEFITADIDNPNVFTISQESLDLADTFNYKGYNVYFLVLKIQCNSMDKIVSTKINSITININGEDTVLSTPYFHVCNGVNGISNNYYNDGTLLFGGAGSNVLVSSSMPSKEKPAVMGLVNKNAIEVNSFHILDYLSIDTFEFNGTSFDPSAINSTINSNSNLEFVYSLKYKHDCSEKNIIRVARIVIFSENGTQKAFIDGAGTYIYLGLQEQLVIKNYIDTL